MPKLLNERHELYATYRAKGFSPAKAALSAGYASGSSTSAELEKTPEIEARRDELIEELRLKREMARNAAVEASKVIGQMTGVGKAWVLTKLSENAQLAMSDGEYKDANEALKLIGEEFGMFKGGSAADPNAEMMSDTFNLDTLEAILGKSDDAVDPMKVLAPPTDEAIRLIEGFDSGKKLAAERRLQTGSETDVALTDEVDVDACHDSDEEHGEMPERRTKTNINRTAKGRF
jgi:hypothetical protein